MKSSQLSYERIGFILEGSICFFCLHVLSNCLCQEPIIFWLLSFEWKASHQIQIKTLSLAIIGSPTSKCIIILKYMFGVCLNMKYRLQTGSSSSYSESSGQAGGTSSRVSWDELLNRQGTLLFIIVCSCPSLNLSLLDNQQGILRDGPLENLWGRKGRRGTKNIFAQGKIKWKNILHAN